MKELVSIIIPVYEAARHVEECLESALEQKYSPLEILLVNDGSTDEGPAICETYSRKYEHVRVLHQEHQGAGVARETGVRNAKGKYILFLDADDKLEEEHSISKLVEQAMQSVTDITVGSFRTFSEAGISDVNEHHLEKETDTDSISFRFKGYFQYSHLGFQWGKLYRKEFLENNRIQSPLYSYIEDKAYNMRCSACKPRYAFVKESVYQYRLNREVVPFQDKNDFTQVWTRVAKDFEGFLQERECTEKYADMIAFHMFLGAYSLAKIKLNQSPWGIWSLRNALKEYGSDIFTQKYLRKLAKGEYLRQIDVAVWKMVIRMASGMFVLRGYLFMALGLTLLSALRLDKAVIAKKYRKK